MTSSDKGDARDAPPAVEGQSGPVAGMSAKELRAVVDLLASVVMPNSRWLSDAEVAHEAGVDVELGRRLRRAMGLPDVPVGESAYMEADVGALMRVRKLMEVGGLDTDDLLHMARTLGLAAARMADAVVGFWSDRLDTGGRDAMVDADRLDDLQWLVGYLFRRHLLDSATRQVAMDEAGGEDGPTVCVGFADLVGFTSLAEQLSDRETAELIERFEELANDTVVGGGGRVIKMIGDEVMWSCEPAAAGRIAIALAESFSSPDVPSVRVGAACGPVVSQAGDLFGPVVNLASRATIAARPGTVLVSPSLAEVLAEDESLEVQPLRPHRLKGIGFVRLARVRRARRSGRS